MDSILLCKSARGKDMLCANGVVMFYLNKRNNDTCYWECQLRKRQKECKAVCEAKITTKTNKDGELEILKQMKHAPKPQRMFMSNIIDFL